jgi:hypothetical protein
MRTAYIHTDEFNRLLGAFHYNWAALDVRIDYTIYKFLKVTPLQAHLITSGMMFGRKIRLLVDLIKHSDDPKKSELLAVLGRITKANRDILTHSYVKSDMDSVTFMERKISGPFSAKEHSYTIAKFREHMNEVYQAELDFDRLLDTPRSDLDEFAQAALSAARK